MMYQRGDLVTVSIKDEEINFNHFEDRGIVFHQVDKNIWLVGFKKNPKCGVHGIVLHKDVIQDNQLLELIDEYKIKYIAMISNEWIVIDKTFKKFKHLRGLYD